MPFTATWMNLNIAIQHTPVFLPGESPWTEEPGWLQSMGSQRVRHDLATKTPSTYLYIYLSTCLYLTCHLYICISIYPCIYGDFTGGSVGKESSCPCKRCGFHPWVRKFPQRRKWLPTPEFLPGKIPWREEPGRLSFTGSQNSWGIKARSPTLQEDSLPAEPPGKHQDYTYWVDTNNLKLKTNQMFQNLIIV